MSKHAMMAAVSGPCPCCSVAGVAWVSICRLRPDIGDSTHTNLRIEAEVRLYSGWDAQCLVRLRFGLMVSIGATIQKGLSLLLGDPPWTGVWGGNSTDMFIPCHGNVLVIVTYCPWIVNICHVVSN